VQEEKKKKQDAILQRKHEALLKRHEEQALLYRRMAFASRKKMNREVKGGNDTDTSRLHSGVNRTAGVESEEEDEDYSQLLTKIHDRLEAGAYRAFVLRSLSLKERKHGRQSELRTMANLQKVKQMQEDKQVEGAIKFKAKMDLNYQARMELISNQVMKLAKLNTKKRQKHDEEVKRQRIEMLRKEKLLKLKEQKHQTLIESAKAQTQEAIRLHQEKEQLKANDARENVTKENRLQERQKQQVLQKHLHDAEMVLKLQKDKEELARQAKQSWEEAKRLRQVANEKMQMALEKLN
jgi:hypothetical protein